MGTEVPCIGCRRLGAGRGRICLRATKESLQPNDVPRFSRQDACSRRTETIQHSAGREAGLDTPDALRL